MSPDELITLAVVAGLIVALAREVTAPAVAVMVSALALLLTGVIDPDQAFSGFSSTAVITVGALFVVAGAVEQTGVLTSLVGRVLGTDRPRLSRLLIPVAASSSVMNNTPIVAAMAPAVLRAARAAGQPASRYLMPLSYATILGGVITTIGTSTNLVVSGLVAQRGMAPFSLLEMAPLGLPVAVVGISLLLTTSGRLLPDRTSPEAQVMADPRRYTLQLQVVEGGRLDGVEVGRGSMRRLAGTYLAARQAEDGLHPLGRGSRLFGGDVLSFVGDVAAVADLLADGSLKPVEAADADGLSTAEGQLVEVVLDASSDIVGRSLSEVGFRGRYGAVVVAAHRLGEPLHDQLGRVPLRAGDALLLLCDTDDVQQLTGRTDFSIVAPLQAAPAITSWRTPATLAVVATMVAVSALGLVDVLLAATGAVLVLLGLGCTTSAAARRAIDLDVLVIIAGSFALGAAVEQSGLATRVAGLAAASAGAGGRWLGVVVLVGLTMLLTEPLSNAAAAALMLPVALDVADRLGGDPRTFAVAVAIAASASFLTPIGYQTNTMVYGLGGYRFSDYARLGAPLTVAAMVTLTVGVLTVGF